MAAKTSGAKSLADTERVFLKGAAQFNRGEFFAAHETWEEIWLPARQPDKNFLHGIIQVAAEFHHCQRRNLRGTLSLLRKGLKKLEKFAPGYRGLQLEPLRAELRQWIASLVSGASRPESFPRISRATRKPD